MPVATSKPERRLFPVYIAIDASGSMLQHGKWEVAFEMISQSLEQIQRSPDPDYEMRMSIFALHHDAIDKITTDSPVNGIFLPDVETGGSSNYSKLLDELIIAVESGDYPPNSHPPCLVIIGDGHVDETFDTKLDSALNNALFKACTRMVVEIGSDFDPRSLKNFVSSPDNFFTVMDLSTMPLFYMRLAARITSQPSSSRSRRILAE